MNKTDERVMPAIRRIACIEQLPDSRGRHIEAGGRDRGTRRFVWTCASAVPKRFTLARSWTPWHDGSPSRLLAHIAILLCLAAGSVRAHPRQPSGYFLPSVGAQPGDYFLPSVGAQGRAARSDVCVPATPMSRRRTTGRRPLAHTHKWDDRRSAVVPKRQRPTDPMERHAQVASPTSGWPACRHPA
jgi:hypothetical protein